jgi:REP element-mobilizing transposase RayT
MGRKPGKPAPFHAYGGQYLRTRAGRKGARRLGLKKSIHFSMRSKQARGVWSFKKPKNNQAIRAILKKFSGKYKVKVHSEAINLNHLHLHLSLPNRHDYNRFIRAITGAIAMAVTSASKNNPLSKRFWDTRPYSRPVYTETSFKRVTDYVRVNMFEALGLDRIEK